jgi:hypothetical protein
VGGTFAEGLERKLGFRDGQRIALIGATDDVLDFFQSEFPMLEFSTSLRGGFDVVVYFATRNSDLSRRINTLTRSLRDKGALWIAWPKKTSRIVTDLSFDVVQETGISQSLVDTKICSISEVWSALRFARRASTPLAVTASV